MGEGVQCEGGADSEATKTAGGAVDDGRQWRWVWGTVGWLSGCGVASTNMGFGGDLDGQATGGAGAQGAGSAGGGFEASSGRA